MDNAEFSDIPKNHLRSLVHRYGIVILRGFNLPDEKLEIMAQNIGKCSDGAFGKTLVLETDKKNTSFLTSTEPLPFHKDMNPPNIPLMQLFRCIEPYPEPDDPHNGRTLFVDTRRLLDHFSEGERAFLRSQTIRYHVAPHPSMGKREFHMEYPVLTTHPVTGEEVVHFFNEPWGEDTLRPTRLEGDDPDALERCLALIVPLLRDGRFCYSHAWRRGDVVVTDNVAQLHARTAVKLPGRVIHRVHVD